MQNQGHDAAYVTDTIQRGDQFIQFWKELPSEPDMARTKAAGVRVNYCCTNDPNMLKRLFDMGIEFPLVDDVETMVEAAKALGIEPNRPVGK
jgi:glycerophosphoryl diester phosphodiesterase